MTKAEREALAEGVCVGLKPVFESYKIKIAALEQANKDLEARVLELEAQHAAATLKVDV